MQVRPAHAERITEVLIRTCSVAVERDGEALNANSCHRLLPFRRLTPQPDEIRRAQRQAANAAISDRVRQHPRERNQTLFSPTDV